MVGAWICLVWLLAHRACWQERGLDTQSQLITMICISVHSFGYIDWMSWALPTCFSVAEWPRCHSNHSTGAFSSACRITELVQSRRCLPWNTNTLLCSGLGAAQSLRRHICCDTTGGARRAHAPHPAPYPRVLSLSCCTIPINSERIQLLATVIIVLKPCSGEGCCCTAQMYPTSSTECLMDDYVVQMQILWNSGAGLYCRIMWEERRSKELNLGKTRLL